MPKRDFTVTQIGCEAYIVRNGQILLGQRGNVHGNGTWAMPGGHLELMERADDCLVRELAEEMAILAKPSHLSFLAFTDDIQSGAHYLHVTFRVDIGAQEPELCEPEACLEWRWFSLDDLPRNIYPPHAKIFATIAGGQPYRR